MISPTRRAMIVLVLILAAVARPPIRAAEPQQPRVITGTYHTTNPLYPQYDGPVAVLVDAMTGSAGDLFAYAMQTDHRALIVGYTPTGGFTGEVGDGQYNLPGGLQMQVPTGRPIDPVTGATLIEGRGVQPDIRVPLTRETLLSPEDEVLLAAEAALAGR